MPRVSKGRVSVEAFEGRLRLRLPRAVYAGRQRYLYLALPDTPINRSAAEGKALAIEGDIAFDRFDHSLDRYRVQAHTLGQIQLGALWGKYTAMKSEELQQTTIDRDFKRVCNHISRLPSDNLMDARKIRQHLLNSGSRQTAKKILMHFNACCEWALEEGLITTNPFGLMPAVKSVKPRQPIHPFSSDETAAIINGFNEHSTWHYYAPFVKFLFWTGTRTSEAIGLRWGDVASDLSEITISSALVGRIRKGTKTCKVRQLPLNDSLKGLLANLDASGSSESLVFTAPGGNNIDAHNFLNRIWRGILSDLPIVYRPQYNTRHTFITMCLKSGVPVTQISEWVGNSPKTIWTHYAGFINAGSVPDFN